MNRIIDHYLERWRASSRRKPLIIKGARQVGKTHAVRRFGRAFVNFVEINFEEMDDAKLIFMKNLTPDQLVKKIEAYTGQKIIPGETLLFFDEVQIEPRVITALRYFYELMPEQHVIAAGSLLDFALVKVGMPVGRVTSYHMYPMSFIEFLCALEHSLLAKAILTHPPEEPMGEPLHGKALDLLGEYIAVGGMPEVVSNWRKTSSLQNSLMVQGEIIDSYVDDFPKYARTTQTKYVDLIFRNTPQQLASQYRTYKIEGEFRKRELAPAIELLQKAKIITAVNHSAGQGMPLAAQEDPRMYKLIMLDVALTQTLSGLKLNDWLINPHQQYVNKGPIIEAFVGQEIMAYSDPRRPAFLYYWQRKEKNSTAEVDYLFEKDQLVIPVEVKSDKGTSLKSMRIFLDNHKKSPYGVRFSTHDYSVYEKIHSYPLYAVAGFCVADKEALLHFVSVS